MNLALKLTRRSILGLMMIALIPVAEATVPPIPKGIFCMPPVEPNGFPDQILTDTRIVGLEIAGSWSDLEPTEGVYDWSSLDTLLAQAEAHGKKVLLRIVSGGMNTPDWVLSNPNVQTFTFIDTNPYHSTYGQPVTIPLYWDPTFLAKETAFIAAAGAHFSSHSSVQVVACAFANSTTGDWGIPDSPDDIANLRAAGYTTQKMVDAGQTIVDATMAAFPNQNISMSIGRGAGDLDPTQDYLSETIVDYATTTYGRFITEKNCLAATTTDPAVDTADLFNWQVLYDQSPRVAAQMLWYVSGDSTYRMNNGTPGNPADILLQAVTIGAHFGTQFQEIYESDLKDPTLSSAIDAANSLLTAPSFPPSAPNTLAATSSSPWTVDLTWHDNANNELAYRIQSKIGSTGTYGLVTTLGPNTTAASVNGLLEGTQYYFRVQAVNANGVSGFSNETSATTVLNYPGTLIAQASSSSQVVLNWTDRSATETGFTVERSAVTNSDYRPIATVGANITSFTDSGLSAGTTYWYRVRAFNTYTTSDYSNEKQVTTFASVPAAPSGLTITSLQSNKITLSWTDNSTNEQHFVVQRKRGASGTYTNVKTTAANVTMYTDRNITGGTLYYYRVYATNSAGNSAFSNEVSGTSPLSRPTRASATAVSSSRINVSWTDNSNGETGYKIERKTTSAGTYTQIAQVGANVETYSDTNGLDANTRYYYRIRATNGTIDSDYSNQPSALTPR
jgi:Fibronectin type III domain/Beta-galactosidase